MAKAAFCIATSQTHADSLVRQLKSAGFRESEVSVLFPEKSGPQDLAREKSTKSPEGALTGAGAGGAVGAALGWMAGIGALAIPGAGPFIVAGPLLAAISGAAVGAAVGGIAGALIGMGVPEREAKRYEEKVKGGSILVSVHCKDILEGRRAKEIFEAAGAQDIAMTSDIETEHGARAEAAFQKDRGERF